MASNFYFMGQGRVWIGKRSGASVLGYDYLGDCSMLDAHLGPGISQFAKNGTATRDPLNRPGPSPQVSFKVENFNPDTIAAFTHGSKTSVSGAAVSNEAVVAYTGKTFPLANMNLDKTVAVLVRSNDLSVTYTLGTDYTVTAAPGTLTIPAGSAITNAQALKVSYTFKAYDKISVGTVIPDFYSLRLEGVNAADGNNAIVAELYKIKFRPVETLPLIASSHVSLALDARMYYDTDKADDTANGRLMRVMKV